jgi:hypothetical protein
MLNLSRITYQENTGSGAAWELEPVEFRDLNLLVGRNATGKTRVLSTIRELASLLATGGGLPNRSGVWEVAWKNGAEYRYNLQIAQGLVESELLAVGGVVRLQRTSGGVGRIWAERLGQDLDFQSPQTTLAVVARQDAIQHSYLQPLLNWARSLHYFPFTTMLVGIADGSRTLSDLLAETQRSEMWRAEILKDLSKLGYDILELGVVETSSPKSPREIFIKEARLNTITPQHAMSQGTFRSIALVVHLSSLLASGERGCVLIDDFAEGLDFQRAGLLLDLLVEKCRLGGFQLIMSTNDRVVMNKVPLDCWSVLEQDGTRTTVCNAFNSPERFEQFKFTGLSNFDFFSMDFAGEQGWHG